MAPEMHSVPLFKSLAGAGHMSALPPSQPSTLSPWWVGSQPHYRESFGQLRPSTGDHPNRVNKASAGPQLVHHDVDQWPAARANTADGATKFLVFPDQKDSRKCEKLNEHSASISLSSPEYQGSFELGLGQSMVFSDFANADQYYGMFATSRAQATGRMLLPLNITAEGPVYVNPKQFQGILRRRQARAKLEMKNKLIGARKPYLHESRHLHAMRRARGCGGRFLNTKKERNGCSGKANDRNLVHPGKSPSSELLQSNIMDLNSGLSLSGTEVTSLYNHEDVDHFQAMTHLRPSIFQLFNMDGDQGPGIPDKWGAVADGCCDLLKV